MINTAMMIFDKGGIYPLKPPDVYIDDTRTEKRFGVYANRAFDKGEVVEKCPVVLFEMPFNNLPESIKERIFDWEVLAKTESKTKNMHAIALGFGSMYNHDNPSNMRYEADPKNRILKFITVRPITKAEELTINYNAKGGGSTWHDNNWFKRRKKIPLTISNRNGA